MDRGTLVESILKQARWCEKLGSPFYQNLLLRIADDVQSSGVCWRLLQQRRAESRRSLLPLRFLAAIHRLVLENQLPEVAVYYPTVGGLPDAEAAWQTLKVELKQCGDLVMSHLPESVQTNEVSRCCALLPGFLAIARSWSMPLRLLELGCSAGLNLRWDCYRYETPSDGWGSPLSPVCFVDPFTGLHPDLRGAVAVAERAGCDLHPIDPTTAEGRLALLSFVWPDQVNRFRLLSAAIELARIIPVNIQQANALDWLPAQLSTMSSGVVTVVFHSIFMFYLSRADQEWVANTLRKAGKRAQADTPLAWLRMEKSAQEVEVQLTVWPGGECRRIAVSDYHGVHTTIL
jgi:hypothetical protein